jgi:transformation/transcription domain-associated protein
VPSISSSLRPHIPDLVKLLQKLVSDTTQDWSQKETIENVSILIQTLNSQILYLGELRKSFLAAIASIAEQKDASALHRVILEVLRKWVLDPTNEGFPTMKEKANLALKLSGLKSHADTALFHSYMSFVAEIYEAGHLNRTEITVRLETVFLEGTQSQDRELRSRFLKLLNESIPVHMATRLSYILGNIVLNFCLFNHVFNK